MASLRAKFGKRVRALRLAHGYTQERFAEAAGISVDFLSLVERGINAPSFETLESFSRVLRIAVAELFLFDKIPPTASRGN